MTTSDYSGKHIVYNGDCRNTCSDLYTANFRPHFIFADPPFNIGQEYDAHNDNMSREEFRQFTIGWFNWAASMLGVKSVFAVHHPDSMNYALQRLAYQQELSQVDWIIWHYRFGMNQRKKFNPSRAHCLVYKKHDNVQHTFNANDVLTPSDRAAVYNDSRTLDSPTPGERVHFDVWSDIPRLVGNAHEKIQGYPNQLPEAYIERLLLAYTNPGDWVLDMFGGTGTVAAVCKMLGRYSVTCEISEKACADIIKRVNHAPQGMSR